MRSTRSISCTQLAVRYWAGIGLFLVIACPAAFYAAYFIGLGASVGGTRGAVTAEVILVPLAGVIIWRWRPDQRNPAVRAVVLASICIALALGGAFIVFVVHMFSDPVWDF